MTEWLDGRYISRDEHHKIVEYYRKLVARLYSEVRELRQQEDAAAIANLPGNCQQLSEPPWQPSAYEANVIRVDFRQPR